MAAKINVSIVEFANAKVLDEAKNEIKIGLLWREQTVVFIFLRHFGCIACRAHAKQIWEKRQQFKTPVTRLIFVGNGEPQAVVGFRQELGLVGAEIYTDPTLVSFRAAGFKRGFLASIGISAQINIAKLEREGAQHKGMYEGAGDRWQLGGIMVVNTQGKPTYQYISEATGDFPPEKDVVENANDSVITA